MKYLLFDTETTGLILHPDAKDNLQPTIIEWGGLLVESGGVELKELDLLINPGVPLPAAITKITGLTDADLCTAPSFAEVLPQLREMFEAADVLVSHNLPFDRGMMELCLRRVGALEDWPWPAHCFCTVQEHAEEWGARPKLTDLYEQFMGKPLAQTHRALDDVRALKEICIKSGVLR